MCDPNKTEQLYMDLLDEEDRMDTIYGERNKAEGSLSSIESNLEVLDIRVKALEDRILQCLNVNVDIMKLVRLLDEKRDICCKIQECKDKMRRCNFWISICQSKCNEISSLLYLEKKGM